MTESDGTRWLATSMRCGSGYEFHADAEFSAALYAKSRYGSWGASWGFSARVQQVSRRRNTPDSPCALPVNRPVRLPAVGRVPPAVVLHG